jgi:hypothetical protein
VYQVKRPLSCVGLYLRLAGGEAVARRHFLIKGGDDFILNIDAYARARARARARSISFKY